jgi:hypothetical protein
MDLNGSSIINGWFEGILGYPTNGWFFDGKVPFDKCWLVVFGTMEFYDFPIMLGMS